MIFGVWDVLGLLLGALRVSWDLLGTLGVLLGCFSWNSWALSGCSWGALGALLASLGTFRDVFLGALGVEFLKLGVTDWS